MLDCPLIVAGTGTNVGKTVVSAILTHLLGADYWKPIQCGNLEESDSDVVRNLTDPSQTTIHPESYRFKGAASPHYAAALENQTIDLTRLQRPKTTRPLVIEMAGGLLVPLTPNRLLVDVCLQWPAHWVIVSKTYVGSINHTLLTVEALRARSASIRGIIFNGPSTPSTENLLLAYTGLPSLGRLDPEPTIDRNTVQRYAQIWRPQISKVL